MTCSRPLASLALGAALLLAGCVPAQTGETKAWEQVSQVGSQLGPPGPRVPATVPTADSPLADFARYAVVNHPAVFASYQDWRAAVGAIASSRALPDPRLTFEADISSTLMTLMPGVMFDLMAGRKRSAMAGEATAASQVAYRTYAGAVFRVASEVRKSWIELAYLRAALDLKEDSRRALEQGSALAQAEYTTGKGMGTLEVQVRLANEAARVLSELDALRDRLASARSVFKASLGLLPTDPDPAWPEPRLVTTALPAEEEMWERIRSSNADLARMQAMVDMALASVAVARTAGTPDASAGLMADLRANPLMIRPTASVTLPVWREKIASLVAASEARRDAATARVGAEQLAMAAQLARMLAMVRESDRMIAYIDGTALTSSERIAATAEAAYQSGLAGPRAIAEARLMALAMRLERAAALRDREEAATELALMMADDAPSGSPLISETDSDRSQAPSRP